KFPPTQTPLVAVHCDAVLTAIGAGHFPFKPDELLDDGDFDGVVTWLPDGKPASVPGSTSREASQSASDNNHPLESIPTPFNPPAATEPLLHSGDETAGNSPYDPSANELRGRSGGSNDEASPDRLSARPVL